MAARPSWKRGRERAAFPFFRCSFVVEGKKEKKRTWWRVG